MKGVLFNVAEDVVDETVSDAAWDQALGHCCLDGVYTSLGDYPDEELAAIVAAALGAHRACHPTRCCTTSGCTATATWSTRQPDLVEGITDLGSLLHHLEHVIHPEVAKLQPDRRTAVVHGDRPRPRDLAWSSTGRAATSASWPRA